MIINLDELFSNVKDSINVSEDIFFNDEDLSRTSIIKLNDVKFNGKIVKSVTDEIELRGILSGTMYIEDSISLDVINYPFEVEIEESLEENLKNNQNTIDIIPILWQNIVLEVPLRYTEVKDLSSYSGDGWKLISEEEVKFSNNPFLELSEKYKEE